MLKKDYLLRFISTFFEGLKRISKGIEEEDPKVFDKINESYKLLGNTRAYFLKTDIEAIVSFFKEKDLKYIQMLSELLYYDAKHKEDKELLKKAIQLADYYLENTKDFSLELQRKIMEMKCQIASI